ncbi:MAG: hypothetical protein EXR96_08920 [Nitrospiraceae bacterium]|nr:hypothetical protein [Nitrospiraceae bacterium]
MASKPVGFVLGMLTLLAVLPAGSAQAAPPPAHMKEYAITVDATTLHPPTRWQVPGITPMIMTMDPDSTEAYATTERRELKLKPGSYKFGTFTFDFPFQVTLDGKLDFAQSLDQCVAGRGTQMLMVTCSRMYPYGGKREYDYK